MHHVLLTHIERMGGAIGLEQLKARGLTTDDVQFLVRAGLLRRVRRGAYVHAELWSTARPSARLGLTAAAVVRSLSPNLRERAVVSHRAAAALWGLPLLGGWKKIDVMLTSGTRRGDSLLRFHVDDGPNTWCPAPFHDIRVATAALSVLQVGAQSGVVAGVVAGDAALHRRLCTADEMRSVMDGLRRAGPSSRQLVPLLDARSESPGESLVRIHVATAGIPVIPQVEIRDGGFTARVDMLVEGTNLIIEFDGNVKYETDGGSALIREKRREDRLRELGYLMLRVVWADLSDVPALIERVRHHLKFARSTPDSATAA